MEPVVSILQLWNIQGICIENHKFQNDYCLLQILNVMLGHAGTHLGWHSKELSWIILIFFAFPKDSEKRRWSIFNWCGMLLAIWHFLCWKLQDHAPRSSTLHSAWSGWTHGAERKTVAESVLSTGRPHVSCQHIASVGAGEWTLYRQYLRRKNGDVCFGIDIIGPGYPLPMCFGSTNKTCRVCGRGSTSTLVWFGLEFWTWMLLECCHLEDESNRPKN